jgi:hypothetical protein
VQAGKPAFEHYFPGSYPVSAFQDHLLPCTGSALMMPANTRPPALHAQTTVASFENLSIHVPFCKDFLLPYQVVCTDFDP